MSSIKTTVNDANVEEFLNGISDEIKRQDSFKLLELYKKITGEPPKMWGSSIVGFGQYHYKSERSSQEGDWPLAGFSPRKQSLTLYVDPYQVDLDDLLKILGDHTTSKACLYIKKLSDVDIDVLKKVIEQSYLFAKNNLL